MEKHLIFSEEWLCSYKELLDVNERYKEVASDWEGDFIFEITPDYDSIEEPIRLYIDLWHGRIRDIWVAKGDEKPDFVYSGFLENWKKLIAKKIGPIRALMSRKFKLQGSYSKVVRYIAAAQELVDTAARVPTRFPDE